MHARDGRKERKKKCDTLYHTALYKKCAVVTMDLCVGMYVARRAEMGEWMDENVLCSGDQ